MVLTKEICFKMAAFKNFAIRKVAIKKVLLSKSEILLTTVQNYKKYITFGNLRTISQEGDIGQQVKFCEAVYIL